jgi:hypothetical protein
MSSTIASASAASAPAPIACTLTEQELRVRQEEVTPLFGHVTAVRELPDGFAFAFPPDPGRAHDVLDLILAERDCCAFFTFDLTFPTPHDAIWLSLRGSAEIKEFVRGGFLNQVTARMDIEPAK